jgi:magnesium and cobalt transporter
MRELARRETEPPSLLDSLFRRLRDLAGRGDAENGSLRETLEELIEEAEEGEREEFTPEQRALLLNALSFGQLQVDDVMVPRADIQSVPAEASLAQVVAAMRDANMTRLIVYRETLDDVLGIVHVTDLLDFWGDGDSFHLEAVVRPVHVVPPSMRVIDLLLEMRDSKMHIAVVVDEFGGTDGIVTLEDLVEELVGELHKGEEQTSPHLLALPDGSLQADGRVDLEELERHLGVQLLEADDRDEADTLAGLIFSLIDRVPQKGEIVAHPSGFRFEVLDSDPRRIRRVRIIQGGDGPGTNAEQEVRGA